MFDGLDALEDDIASFFRDTYEVGTERTAGMPVLYLDAEEMKTVAEARAYMQQQFPELDFNELSDKVIRGLMTAAKDNGPFATLSMTADNSGCIVNKPNAEYDTKEKIIPKLTHIDPSKIGYVPGNEALWMRVIGVHEGVHCSQKRDETLTGNDKILATLKREVAADRAAIKYLETAGQDEMAQAFRDYRTIGALNGSPTHITAMFIDGEEPTLQHVEAVQKFDSTMYKGVADELNITPQEAKKLLDKDPRKFIDTVDKLAAEGKFDGTPLQKQFIEQYAGAYRRQILDNPGPQQDLDYEENPGPDESDMASKSLSQDEMSIATISRDQTFQTQDSVPGISTAGISLETSNLNLTNHFTAGALNVDLSTLEFQTQDVTWTNRQDIGFVEVTPISTEGISFGQVADTSISNFVIGSESAIAGNFNQAVQNMAIEQDVGMPPPEVTMNRTVNQAFTV